MRIDGCRRRLLRFLIEPLVNHQKIAVSTFEKVPNNQFAIKYDDTRIDRSTICVKNPDAVSEAVPSADHQAAWTNIVQATLPVKRLQTAVTY